MPTYDYACPSCGGFAALRSLADRNEPAICPECSKASPRVFVSAPRPGLREQRNARCHGHQRAGSA